MKDLHLVKNYIAVFRNYPYYPYYPYYTCYT